MNTLCLLADVAFGSSGQSVIHSLLVLLVVGIAGLLIWWAGKYFISQLGAPPLAMTVWNGLFVLILVIVAVNFLLSLVGYQFIRW